MNKPWMIATWPGMGGVADIAGRYLVHQLGAHQVAEVPSGPYFAVRTIQVASGIVQPVVYPHNLVYSLKQPEAGRDLIVFTGERQPDERGFEFCEDLLTMGRELGAEKFFTFAAMASPIHPQENPRVFAAATDQGTLEELVSQGAEPLTDGEIGGLNGVFLAKVAAHALQGACLLGEFPFFASSIPNPKASSAVLRVFSGLSGVPVDRTQLDEQAVELEVRLMGHLKRLQQDEAREAESEEGTAPMSKPASEKEKTGDQDPALLAYIESLFQEASQDRDKALKLKAELDRHKLFSKYEDRFLDLFKQAE